MRTIEIPDIPSDWIDYGDVIISEGTVPHCAVLHRSGSEYHPLVVHTACVQDGEWVYQGGQYFKIDDLWAAQEALHNHHCWRP